MKTDQIKQMMDACYLAKRILDMLPDLPEGVNASYIRFLDMIEKLKRETEKVRVSDISDAMHLPRPGVTRTLKEMEEKGYVKKVSSETDGRITYIELTEAGQKLSHAYNTVFFEELSESMNSISEEEMKTTVSVIENMYEIMLERRNTE